MTSSLPYDKLSCVSQPTPTYQLIEERLGQLPARTAVGDGTLAAYVRSRRPEPPASWRQIAAELRELTGVNVSHESLRAWFADRESGSAA